MPGGLQVLHSAWKYSLSLGFAGDCDEVMYADPAG